MGFGFTNVVNTLTTAIVYLSTWKNVCSTGKIVLLNWQVKIGFRGFEIASTSPRLAS
jgi:hypothetical protein